MFAVLIVILLLFVYQLVIAPAIAYAFVDIDTHVRRSKHAMPVSPLAPNAFTRAPAPSAPAPTAPAPTAPTAPSADAPANARADAPANARADAEARSLARITSANTRANETAAPVPIFEDTDPWKKAAQARFNPNAQVRVIDRDTGEVLQEKTIGVVGNA